MQAQEHKVHLKKKMASLQLHLFCVKIVGTMTHLSVPVLLNLYRGRHNSSALTFWFLLTVICAVNARVKTDADCGEGMIINNENYDGFCKRAFVCFCYCFSASTSFSDVWSSGVCSLGNEGDECTEED